MGANELGHRVIGRPNAAHRAMLKGPINLEPLLACVGAGIMSRNEARRTIGLPGCPMLTSCCSR